MSRRIELVFENGVFKPVEAVDWLHEHELVEAEVHTSSDRPTDSAGLKEFPFRDLSWLVPLTDKEAEKMLADIDGALRGNGLLDIGIDAVVLQQSGSPWQMPSVS